MEPYIASLDIGTSRITLAVAVHDQDGVGVRRVYCTTSSRGVVNHMIANQSDVVKCVRELLESMSMHLGVRIERIHFAYSAAGKISCEKIEVSTTCNTPESNASRSTVVSAQDIEHLVGQCETVDESKNSSLVIDKVPLAYFADGNPIRSSLEGTYASTFSCVYNRFLAERKAVSHWNRLFEKLGLTVVSSPLGIRGVAASVSTALQRNEGIAVLDVGTTRSHLAVYYDDALQHYAWIERGGADITAYVAGEHGLSQQQAEEQKLSYMYLEKDVEEAICVLSEDGDCRAPSVGFTVCAGVYELVEEVMRRLTNWKVLERLKQHGLVLAGGGIAFQKSDTVFSQFAKTVKAGVGCTPMAIKVAIGCPPMAEGIESITGSHPTLSDLMRMLPVMGILEMKLGDLDPSPAIIAQPEPLEDGGVEAEGDMAEREEAIRTPGVSSWVEGLLQRFINSGKKFFRDEEGESS